MGPYIMQNLLILIAPAFMAASIYMILGRIIELTEGEKYSLVRKQWLTKLFVMGDVASLLFQSTGQYLFPLGLELEHLANLFDLFQVAV